MSNPKNKGTKLFFSQYGGEQPIPPEFIAAMNRVEEIQPVPNDVGAETLSDTIVESKVETNRTNERVRRTVKKKAGNIVLSAIHTNDQGQPVQVTRTLFPTGTTPMEPTATTNVAVQDLGNGWSIQEVGVEGTYVAGTFTPGIFTGNEWTNKSQPYPAEYVTVENTTIADSVGTASAPTASTGGSKTEQQKTEFVKRVSTTIPSTNSTVTEAETNRYKQKVTIVRQHTATVGNPSATVDVEQRAIPGGRTEAITKTVASVFDEVVYAKQRIDAVPERFKKATPEITEKHVTAGTASVPSLSSGDIVKSEQQKDAFVKETSVTNKAVGGYPTLSGQTYDESLDVEIPYTEAIVADGTGGARADVTPLGIDIYGAAVALKKAIDISAVTTVFDAYMLTFPGSASLDLPDELIDVTSYLSRNTGDGSYTEEANGTLTGNGSISLRGNGQGSMAIVPSIIPTINGRWGRNVPTTNYIFLLPSPVSSADVIAKVGSVSAWPKFSPQNVTIISVARQMSIRCDASAQLIVTDPTTTEITGSGSSREVGLTIQHTHIPATIHDSLSVSGEGVGTFDSDSVTVEAHAHIVGPGVYADSAASGTIEAEIITTGIGATPGETTVPTSGVRILRSSGSPYKYGYVMMHVETVDFADV